MKVEGLPLRDLILPRFITKAQKEASATSAQGLKENGPMEETRKLRVTSYKHDPRFLRRMVLQRRGRSQGATVRPGTKREPWAVSAPVRGAEKPCVKGQTVGV